MADNFALPFMKVDDQGRITYEFAGHVIASGLDLEAALADPPDQGNAIRWLRQSDNAPTLSIAGVDDGSANQLLELTASGFGFGSDGYVLASLRAAAGAVRGRPGVYVEGVKDTATPANDYQRVTAAPGDAAVVPGTRGNERTIVQYTPSSGAVESDFLQVLSEAGLRTIRGTVDTTGPNGSIVRGAGFSIASRPGVGQLNLTWGTPFGVPPTVITSTNGFSNPADAVPTAAGTLIQRGLIAPPAANAFNDGIVFFLAIGAT